MQYNIDITYKLQLNIIKYKHYLQNVIIAVTLYIKSKELANHDELGLMGKSGQDGGCIQHGLHTLPTAFTAELRTYIGMRPIRLSWLAVLLLGAHAPRRRSPVPHIATQ